MLSHLVEALSWVQRDLHSDVLRTCWVQLSPVRSGSVLSNRNQAEECLRAELWFLSDPRPNPAPVQLHDFVSSLNTGSLC